MRVDANSGNKVYIAGDGRSMNLRFCFRHCRFSLSISIAFDLVNSSLRRHIVLPRRHLNAYGSQSVPNLNVNSESFFKKILHENGPSMTQKVLSGNSRDMRWKLKLDVGDLLNEYRYLCYTQFAKCINTMKPIV